MKGWEKSRKIQRKAEKKVGRREEKEGGRDIHFGKGSMCQHTAVLKWVRQGGRPSPYQLPCDFQVERASLLKHQEGTVKQVLGEPHSCHGSCITQRPWQHKGVSTMHRQEDGFAKKRENGLDRGRSIHAGHQEPRACNRPRAPGHL